MLFILSQVPVSLMYALLACSCARTLVALSFGPDEHSAEAARAALSTLSSYHRDNKMAYLHHLVNCLRSGTVQLQVCNF